MAVFSARTILQATIAGALWKAFTSKEHFDSRRYVRDLDESLRRERIIQIYESA